MYLEYIICGSLRGVTPSTTSTKPRSARTAIPHKEVIRDTEVIWDWEVILRFLAKCCEQALEGRRENDRALCARALWPHILDSRIFRCARRGKLRPEHAMHASSMLGASVAIALPCDQASRGRLEPTPRQRACWPLVNDSLSRAWTRQTSQSQTRGGASDVFP